MRGRVAEQQLRRDASVVLDLVARQPARDAWEALAKRYRAVFTVVECICSDPEIVRTRIEGRTRSIPDWYELTWERVAASHRNYMPLTGSKIVVDAVAPLAANVELLARTSVCPDAILGGGPMAPGRAGSGHTVGMLERDERPWGSYEVLLDAPDHKVKQLVVNPGKRLSYQRHARRSEHWFIVCGTGVVTLNDARIEVGPGSAVDVGLGASHRIENTGLDDIVLIEVQHGEYFGEDDIVRLEDDFGRA